MTGVDLGFFLLGEGGGGGGGGVSWYHRLAESKRHAKNIMQFDNYNLIKNCYSRNTGNAKK